ncbi:response regulator [Acidovorax temperans]
MLTPKVVLVEDNTTIRETLVPALQELAGARVVAMADGAQEALATLRQVPWDVLVLDMFLREGAGLEVLAQLPGELAGRKVYVLTNYATADLRKACVRLGADAVFDKSTELDEFFAAFLA